MQLYAAVGNLVKDVEVRDAGSVKVASFTLAVNRKFKKRDGSLADEVTFVPCEAWDSGAETLAKYTSKGSKLAVRGKFKNENWEKEGQKHSKLVCRVEEFEFLGPSKKAENNTNETGVAVSSDDSGEDIPF